jgi:hypothetical protein
MFLADRTNLESIHTAEFLIFDGTFAYCPREFYQVAYEVDGEVRTTSGQTYTMHSVFSDLPERRSNLLCGKFLNYLLLWIVFRNRFLASQVNRNLRQTVQ